MAINNNVTLIGNMMKPELRYTQNGKAIAKSRMVVKTYGDAEDMWVNVTAWENLATNLNYSFDGHNAKTIRVLVTGRLVSEKWEDKNTGQERSSYSITADSIAIPLDYQTVSGVQYSGEAKSEASYGNDKFTMAKEILNAEPVARTDYGENEAPF